MQRRSSGQSEPSVVPPVVHEVLNSLGQPLDTGTRAFFEPRFGSDFSAVRVHTDAKAAESARAVNALAYTVGRNIVFGEGQHAPQTTAGRRLMAHELTHSLQQTNGGHEQMQSKLRIGSANDSFEQEADRIADSVIGNKSEAVGGLSAVSGVMQRACGPAAIGEPVGCDFAPGDVSGPRYLFQPNCDEFARGNELDLRANAMTIVQGETVEIHGLASNDGDPDYNLSLSCARALRAKAIIEEVLASRGITATLRVFHHGGIPGDATLLRSVVLVRSGQQPQPPTPPTPPTPTTTPFQVCSRDLQISPVGKHAYIEAPPFRYAIISPTCPQGRLDNPLTGTGGQKWDNSPDPCRKTPTCIPCLPAPGVTDVARCLRAAFTAYNNPSLYRLFGPNSNTFAGTLARACCAGMAPKPAALGWCPGWNDSPAPARVGTKPCPPGPTC
jgi:outer membrane protein OmpA-like peptidoglycan-associated protein